MEEHVLPPELMHRDLIPMLPRAPGSEPLASRQLPRVKKRAVRSVFGWKGFTT